MLVQSTIIAVLLTVAVRCFLEEELTSPHDFDISLNAGEPSLFADVFDSSLTEHLDYNDLTLASLQPTNEDIFKNTVLSPQPLASLLSDQPSSCLSDTSPNLSGRSSGSDQDVDYISQPNFCFQDPAKEQPLIKLPDLFDLLPPDPEADPVDLYLDRVFPRRPVCPGLSYTFRLCCDPRGSTRQVNDCVTFDYVEPKCQDQRNIWCCIIFNVPSDPADKPYGKMCTRPEYQRRPY